MATEIATQGRQTFEGGHKPFDPHPFVWKTPTPPGGLRTQKLLKVNLCALFSCLNSNYSASGVHETRRLVCGRSHLASESRTKRTWTLILLLGTDPPDPTLESASPSPPQGSIWHRFRHWFDIESSRFDPFSMPNRPLRRGGRGRFEGGSGRSVPNKPSQLQFLRAPRRGVVLAALIPN